MEYIKVSAKTVEDAILEASIQLGTTSDNIEYHVIERETKGFLGIGAKKALIEARRKVLEEDIVSEVFREKAPKASQKKNTEKNSVEKKTSSEKGEKKTSDDKAEKPEKKNVRKGDKSEKKSSKEGNNSDNAAEKSLKEEKPGKSVKEEKAEKEKKQEKKSEKKQEKKVEKKAEKTVKKTEKSEAAENKNRSENTAETAAVMEKTQNETNADNAQSKENTARVPADPEVVITRAQEFLTQMLTAMGVDAVIRTEYEDGVLNIELEGDDMGVLIGKRGQTLDSIQYLTSLVVNKGKAAYVRVKIDTENYRERRKATLENLARNMAFKVKKTRRPAYLEPMNPDERRIIHSALQGDPYVTTHSEGDEPARKVVITLRRHEREEEKEVTEE